MQSLSLALFLFKAPAFALKLSSSFHIKRFVISALVSCLSIRSHPYADHSHSHIHTHTNTHIVSHIHSHTHSAASLHFFDCLFRIVFVTFLFRLDSFQFFLSHWIRFVSLCFAWLRFGFAFVLFGVFYYAMFFIRHLIRLIIIILICCALSNAAALSLPLSLFLALLQTIAQKGKLVGECKT